MNRKRKPKLPEGIEMPTVEPRIDPDLVTQTRRYKLITPLYGGGVTPGEADPITIVRASEVRGHLRFWWRATRGGQFDGDLEKMRKAEEAIWGSAAGKDKPGPSEVTIVIRVLDRGQPFQATNRKGDSIDNIGHPSSKFGYVAFPLRDSKHPVVLQDVEFELTLTYRKTLKLPFDKIEVKKEVNAAFWAWESFGGLGARTRRGFGAVQLEAIDNATVSQLLSADTEDAINRFLKEHVVDGNWPQDVPHLSHAMHRCVFTYWTLDKIGHQELNNG
ncbi:MAG: type III-B CRISPR module RAMP protein Cmr1 [Caldilineaceae bacterium]